MLEHIGAVVFQVRALLSGELADVYLGVNVPRIQNRAAAPTVCPSSSTNRTAPALNSSVKLRRVRFRLVLNIVDIVSASLP